MTWRHESNSTFTYVHSTVKTVRCAYEMNLYSPFYSFSMYGNMANIFFVEGEERGRRNWAAPATQRPRIMQRKKCWSPPRPLLQTWGASAKRKEANPLEVFTNLVSIFKTQIGLLKIGGMCEGARGIIIGLLRDCNSRSIVVGLSVPSYGRGGLAKQKLNSEQYVAAEVRGTRWKNGTL